MNVGVCRRSSDETGFIWTPEVPLSLQVERVADGDCLPLGVTMDFLSDSSGKTRLKGRWKLSRGWDWKAVSHPQVPECTLDRQGSAGEGISHCFLKLG